jgi:acyl carrier protein
VGDLMGMRDEHDYHSGQSAPRGDMTKTAFIHTLEETLGVRSGELQPQDTRDTVRGWSSLTDVTILTVIFSELGIEAEEDLLDYRSVGELLDILERKRAFSDS